MVADWTSLQVTQSPIPHTLCILRHQALVSANYSPCLRVSVKGGPLQSAAPLRGVSSHISSLLLYSWFSCSNWRHFVFQLCAVLTSSSTILKIHYTTARSHRTIVKVVSETAEKDGLTEAEISHHCSNGSTWWPISLLRWCTSSCHCTTKKRLFQYLEWFLVFASLATVTWWWEFKGSFHVITSQSSCRNLKQTEQQAPVSHLTPSCESLLFTPGPTCN